MGKTKKKNDDKKAALQARKDAKADKAAKKRLVKEAKKSGSAIEDIDNDEENLDDLLEMYRQKDKEVNTTTFETLDGFPPRRANASLTLDEQEKSGQMYLFGGEFFDGIENVVLNDLLKWDPSKSEWKQILTPKPNPAPRCAHSCVYYKKSLFVFGGELASVDQYHHYKDIWRLDLTTHKWEEIVPRNTGTLPTPRSGHTAFVWKHFMIIFGGFYEALHETRWFNDVCVLDLQSYTWLTVPYSKLATRPEPRSACNVGLHGDIAYIQGGFSKLKNPTVKSETKVHTDAWLLHLKPILQGSPPTWERLNVRGAGASPKDRAGTASTTYKGRMLVYGGVLDREQYHHKLESVFFNDLFAFDMERRKWFPLRAKPHQVAGQKKSRRRKKGQEDEDDEQGHPNEEILDEGQQELEDVESDLELEELDENEAKSEGWNLDMLRSNMFAFIDGDGNIVYEKIEEEEEKKQGDSPKESDEEKEEEEEEKEEEEEEEKEEEKVEDNEEEKEDKKVRPIEGLKSILQNKTISSSEVMTMNEATGTPEAVARSEPLPRINARILVRNHIIYIYGGILEVGNREVTLDDCWAFDLRKREKWECIYEGTIHKQVWRGAIHDDDDSYISAGTGGDMSDDSDEDELDDLGELDEEGRREAKAARKLAKKEKKHQGLKQEINELRAKLDLDQTDRTPQLNESVESMAEFYSRTSEYWTGQAAEIFGKDASSEDEKLTNKELKREGFSLAQKRYDELRPVLDRLLELTSQQKEAESGKKEKKGDKKDKDKKKKKKSKV